MRQIHQLNVDVKQIEKMDKELKETGSILEQMRKLNEITN